MMKEDCNDTLRPTVEEQILVRITGQDRPGLTASVMGILAKYDAQILDIGQADIHATLSLGILVRMNEMKAGLAMKELLFKATELGVDCIVPLIGERSERKVYKTDRAARIALSATKQSLKARVPAIEEPVSVKEFLRQPADGLRLIAYCFEGETLRTSIKAALNGFKGRDITILIGPEGDFSPEEARLALDNGYIPIHLGASRLRTETAAVTAVESVYLHFME